MKLPLIPALTILLVVATLVNAERECGKPCNMNLSPVCGLRSKDKKLRTFKNHCELMKYSCEHEDDVHRFVGMQECDGYLDIQPA